MAWRNTEHRFGLLTKCFHWGVMLVFLLMVIAGVTMGDISDDALRSRAIFLHKSTGVFLLLIMLLWWIWTLFNRRPLYPSTMGTVQRTLARAAHYLLFLLIIAMPVTGLLMSSYAGRKTSFYGLFEFIIPVAENREVATIFRELHSIITIAIVMLLIIHIAAALYHQFIVKDNILKRMWFGS